MMSGLLFRGALQVEGEEALEDLVIGLGVGPAVGVEDGAVELAVDGVEFFDSVERDDALDVFVPLLRVAAALMAMMI